MLDDYYLPRSSIDITAGARFGAEFSIGSNDTVAAYRMLSGEGHFRVTNPTIVVCTYQIIKAIKD